MCNNCKVVLINIRTRGEYEAENNNKEKVSETLDNPDDSGGGQLLLSRQR
ncbi:TPA: hypothetical protein IAC10_11350 [Candidatus Scatousia excrementigallinarum]|uniref:Uncharacterized protein n=1 Tax=Candidatus Scatousia excrementigallinarum TaxID=2840935 RepID=A0A9D1JP41_9BACT|nr:hypothetical protein [Candidatus Scatousia excrementigallinarum]